MAWWCHTQTNFSLSSCLWLTKCRLRYEMLPAWWSNLRELRPWNVASHFTLWKKLAPLKTKEEIGVLGTSTLGGGGPCMHSAAHQFYVGKPGCQSAPLDGPSKLIFAKWSHVFLSCFKEKLPVTNISSIQNNIWFWLGFFLDL